MIRIGIVGTGYMAERRAISFKNIKNVLIAGVYSRYLKNAKRICQLTETKYFDNYKNMLSEVDAVVICNPNSLHTSFALGALNRGKHALVEYPLCINNKELNKLQDVISKCSYVLMTGNTIIHEAMFLFLMKHKEKLGNIISASSRVALYSEDISNAWCMNPLYLGPIFSALHYHHIEYYRHFIGEVKWVIGCNESIPNHHKQGYYATVGGTLVMGHINGGTSCIQWYLNNSGNGMPRCIWLNGSKSSVTIISQQEGVSHVIWDNGSKGKIEKYEDEWGINGSCKDFVQAIYRKIDYKKRLDSDIKTLNIGFAAEKSDKIVKKI